MLRPLTKINELSSEYLGHTRQYGLQTMFHLLIKHIAVDL